MVVDGIKQNAVFSGDKYINVTIPFFTSSATFEFYVTILTLQPNILYVTPENGGTDFHIGDTIIIRGTNFGFGLGLGNVVNLADTDINFKQIISWSDTEIVFVCPIYIPLGVGSVKITSPLGDSNAISVNITQRPDIPNELFNIVCSGWGSHFTQYTGQVYDFQGVGEYTFSKVDDIEIQIRQERCGSTCISAVAIKDRETTIAIYSHNGDVLLYINHTRIEDFNSVSAALLDIAPDFPHFVISRARISISVIAAEWLDITVRTFGGSNFGGWCGGLQRISLLQNGTPYPISHQINVDVFSNSWRVSAIESLFDYFEGNYNSHNNESFVPDYPSFDDDADKTAAERICRTIIYDSIMATTCNASVIQRGVYYLACLSDIAANSEMLFGERSIAAFASQCQYRAIQDPLEGFPILATYSTAYGQGVQRGGVSVNTNATFYIQTRDALGQNGASSSNITFSVNHITSNFSWSQRFISNGLFAIDYLPSSVGELNFTISFNPYDTPVLGPYNIAVLDQQICATFGDPHFHTLYGEQFTFQGHGEYLFSSLQFQDISYDIQIRQEPCDHEGITAITAVALKDSDSGEVLVIMMVDGGMRLPFEDNITVREFSFSPNYFRLDIRRVARGLDLTLVVTSKLVSAPIGLCSISHDTMLTSNFDTYANHTRTTVGDSLFTELYAFAGKDYQYYNDLNFIPVYNPDTIDPLLNAKALDACMALNSTAKLPSQCSEYYDASFFHESCIEDVIVTHSAEVSSPSVRIYSGLCYQYLQDNSLYPTLPTYSYATGVGLSGPVFVNKSVEFMVFPRNSIGVATFDPTDTLRVETITSDFEYSILNTNNKYLVNYTAKASGNYSISVLLNNQHIFNSPFTVIVGGPTTSPNTTTARGPGLSTVPSTINTWFIITSRNELGVPVGRGGDTYQVKFLNVDGMSTGLNYTVLDNLDGTYLVTYESPKPIQLTIDIYVNGERILNRYQVTVKGLPSILSTMSWGYPHVSMFSGTVYHMNAFGEYLYAAVGGMKVQVRLMPVTNNITANVAVAAIENGTTLAIYLENGTAKAYKNGMSVTPSLTAGNNEISQRSVDKVFTLSLPSGSVKIRAFSSRLDFSVESPSEDDSPKYALGPSLGGGWDSFVKLRNGSTVAVEYTQSFINSYVESWRVNDTESIFTYTNTSYQQQNRLDFVPNENPVSPSAEFTNKTLALCSVLRNNSALSTCFSSIDPTMYYDSCVSDSYAIQDLSAGEASIIAYSSLCHLTGVVMDIPAIAAYTYLEGPAISTTSIGNTWFTIHPINANGEIVLSSNFKIEIVPNVSITSIVSTSVSINVSFALLQVGQYSVSVRTSDTHLDVQGSPFYLNLTAVPSPSPSPSPSPNPTTTPVNNGTCLTRNGGCDYAMRCTMIQSAPVCSACPQGYNQTSTTSCQSLCGDGQCDATIGENCVSCPRDCNQTTCQTCGDRICNGNETCSTCQEDCGYCSVPACPSNCNNKGTCEKGVCICTQGTGPSCNSAQNEAISLEISETTPDVAIKTKTMTSLNKKFYISIIRLEELSANGESLRSIDISNVVFTTNRYTNGANVIYNFTSDLENGASLEITIIQVNQQTTFAFGDTNLHFQPDTVKVNARVKSWPFYSLTNSLGIVMENGVKNNDGSSSNECTNNEVDENGNLKWTAVIDGRNRGITFRPSSDTTMTAMIPHFWEQADMDPNFSVLLQDENVGLCADPDKHRNGVNKLVLAIVLPIVCFLMIVGALCFIFRNRISTWWKVRKMYRVNSSRRHVEMDVLSTSSSI